MRRCFNQGLVAQNGLENCSVPPALCALSHEYSIIHGLGVLLCECIYKAIFEDLLFWVGVQHDLGLFTIRMNIGVLEIIGGDT